MSKEKEEWRPVIGYEGLYEVSDWGNVRTVERIIDMFMFLQSKYVKRKIKCKLLSKFKDKDGYDGVNFKIKGVHKLGKVHRLVAEAFIPNPENKPYIDHINGIRDDNRVENLRWCTQKENLNFEIAKNNLSTSSKIKVLRRKRNEKGQFK